MSSSGEIAIGLPADSPAGEVEGRTPARIVARLAQDPGEAPEPCTRLTGEDVTLGMLARGDWLGVDGRWSLVERCNSVNGWVTVQTAIGHPSIPAAHEDAPVYLARDIDREGVRA